MTEQHAGGWHAELRQAIREAEAEVGGGDWAQLMDWAWTDWLDFRTEGGDSRKAWYERTKAIIDGWATERGGHDWAKTLDRYIRIRAKLIELPDLLHEVMEGNVSKTRLSRIFAVMATENWFGQAISLMRDVPVDEEIPMAFEEVDRRCIEALTTSDKDLHDRARTRKDGPKQQRLKIPVGIDTLQAVQEAGMYVSRWRQRTGADKRVWHAYSWNDRLAAMAAYILDREEGDNA